MVPNRHDVKQLHKKDEAGGWSERIEVAAGGLTQRKLFIIILFIFTRSGYV